MNKQASGRDVILIVFLMFTLAVSFFLSHFTGTTLETQLANNPGWNKASVGQNATAAVVQTIDKGNSMLDKIIFGFFIGLVLSLLITCWLVGGHPIFMIFFFIFIIIAVVTSIIFSDVMQDIMNNKYYDFGLTSADFPITTNLITYFPYYIAIIGTFGMIIMFGKPYDEGTPR